jgi:hypothetical protein
MEKVWAKASGSYEHIIAGTGQESLYFITGAPSTYFNMTADMGYVPGDNTTLVTAGLNSWNVIQPADAVNFVMLASANGGAFWGLVPDHTYTLTGAFPIKNSAGVITNRLFEIRNPWGIDGFNGPWSDSDTAHWTAANKA